MLGIAGGSVYALLLWRATHLPPDQQTILRNEVLVARGSARPDNRASDIAAETSNACRRGWESRVSGADLAEVQRQIFEQVKAEAQIVPPGSCGLAGGPGLPTAFHQGQTVASARQIQRRRRDALGTFTGIWEVGDQESPVSGAANP